MPWDPLAARTLLERDAADFVSVVRARLEALRRDRSDRPALVVVAYDTELFGHWWHEGPQFLERVLRLLPEAGVRVATLQGAIEAGHVEGGIDLPASSWGSGKDWRVGRRAGGGPRRNGTARAAPPHRHRRQARSSWGRVRRGCPPATTQRTRPDGAGGTARLVERLGVHGDQGLRGELCPRPSGHARVTVPQTRRRRRRGLDVAAEALRQRIEDGPFEHLDARLL